MIHLPFAQLCRVQEDLREIATRAISNRLLAVIGSVVGTDQTCGVPGRTISENLFFICDLIDYVERKDLPVALLSLDWVDWGFLLKILECRL